VFELYDWNCPIEVHSSEGNKGCKASIVDGLNMVFKYNSSAIVLEDDCIPTVDFFRFCDWGLNKYTGCDDIAAICGSNLVADKFVQKQLNGFSKVFCPWGWATWSKTWNTLDYDIDINSVVKNSSTFNIGIKPEWFERRYWLEVFKQVVSSGSTWALILQEQIFVQKLLVVFPAKNLINNIGFGDEATHTKGNVPSFVEANIPVENSGIFSRSIDKSKRNNITRDRLLIKTIWNYGPVTTIRVSIGNIWRYNF